MTEQFVELVPKSLYKENGMVFYSGRQAFERPSRLYILGLNPGGDPMGHKGQDIEKSVVDWCKNPDMQVWSAYTDKHARWGNDGGHAPGEAPMQKRMRHMFQEQLKLRLTDIPASNVVFKRSRRGSYLGDSFERLAEQCWPVHEAVIEQLNVRVVACLGGTAGRWVQEQLGCKGLEDCFIELNNRRWSSRAYVNDETGLRVVVLTHPSVIHWIAPATDPSELVQISLDRSRGIWHPGLRIPAR